jgi:arsenate reductase
VKVAIYHNPRHSRSRQTLELLTGNNPDPEIILYLETSPDTSQIRELLRILELPARKITQNSEQEYKDQNLADTTLSD